MELFNSVTYNIRYRKKTFEHDAPLIILMGNLYSWQVLWM